MQKPHPFAVAPPDKARVRAAAKPYVVTIYGHARVSTDGQSVDAQIRQLRKAGAKKVFREVASEAKTDRPRLRRLLAEIAPGDVVTVTRIGPLGAPQLRPVPIVKRIVDAKAQFRSPDGAVGRYQAAAPGG